MIFYSENKKLKCKGESADAVFFFKKYNFTFKCIFKTLNLLRLSTNRGFLLDKVSAPN